MTTLNKVKQGRLCVDCAHYYLSKGMKEYGIRPKCRAKKPPVKSLVDGKEERQWFMPCAWERSESGKCRPHGKLFKRLSSNEH
jgi:hypothetical protein